MKTVSLFAPIALVAMACQSSSYRSYDDPPVIHDDTFAYVPASERDDINKVRTERLEALDSVQIAEREVEQAKERVKVAKHEVDIAEEEIEAADARLELAQKTASSDESSEVKAAKDNREAVCAHRHWAATQVMLEEARVEQQQARVGVAKAQVELADAKLELEKAKAVVEVDRAECRRVDVAAFERHVKDEEVDLAMAQVDADAYQKKIELRQSVLEERAKAVPASYRDGWRDTSKLPPEKVKDNGKK